MRLLYTISAALLLILNACGHSYETAEVRSPGTSAITAADESLPVEVVRVSATAAAAAPRVGLANPPADSLAMRSDVQDFIQEMVVNHGFGANELYVLFSQAQARPEIIELITRPAEAKPWYAYRSIFLTPARIQGGVQFWNLHADTLARAEQVYGVPAAIIVSIIGVETAYGGNTGRHKVLEALATLAFDYPKRASFFRKELENYLLLTREEGIDPLALQGSYAGAMGLGQFMPSSYRAYAVDFDGDQQRNLWTNPKDAIGSVANYLARHHWQRGAPIAMRAQVDGNRYQAMVSGKLAKPADTVQSLRHQGVRPSAAVSDGQKALLLEFETREGPQYWLGFDNFYVITRYNHSPLYAMAVYQLSQEISGRQY